uniref:Uncharacterized protein n=1 Tax=Timema cristinae TaxID=61476 RepID=A0A7R9H1F6_TIMCR|nr:unnamed protein product [Timema cristinae]
MASSTSCKHSIFIEIRTTLSKPNQDSNPDLPIIGSLIYCKSSALDHAATEERFRRCTLNTSNKYIPDLSVISRPLYCENIASEPVDFNPGIATPFGVPNYQEHVFFLVQELLLSTKFGEPCLSPFDYRDRHVFKCFSRSSEPLIHHEDVAQEETNQWIANSRARLRTRDKDRERNKERERERNGQLVEQAVHCQCSRRDGLSMCYQRRHSH